MRAAALLGGLAQAAASLTPDNRSSGGPAGVWVQHGSTQDLLKQTFVKGGDVTIAWKDEEVAKDVWNWTAMDEEFAAQAAAGFYIETSLQAGPMAPTWLYDDVDKGGAGLTPTLVVMSNHTGALIDPSARLRRSISDLVLGCAQVFVGSASRTPPTHPTSAPSRPISINATRPTSCVRSTASRSISRPCRTASVAR